MILGLPLQTPSVKTGKGAGVEHLVTALVARRYYLDGQTKSQIADELGVSRFKVARILETAVRDGIVRISIDIPPEVDLDLSQKLEQRFGLRQVLVVRTEEDGTLDAMRRMLGRACASLLAGRLSDTDLLGVSWGRTLHALTDVLPPLPHAGVVQMVGSVPTADHGIHRLDYGSCHELHIGSPEPRRLWMLAEQTPDGAMADPGCNCPAPGMAACGNRHFRGAGGRYSRRRQQ